MNISIQQTTQPIDAVLGVVQALGAAADVVDFDGRKHLAITLDLAPWDTIEELRDRDGELLAFRRQMEPVLRAFGFGIDGASTGFSKDRRHYTHRLAASTKGPLTAAEQHMISTFTGRD